MLIELNSSLYRKLYREQIPHTIVVTSYSKGGDRARKRSPFSHITLPVMMYRNRTRRLRQPIHTNRSWSSLKMHTMLMSETMYVYVYVLSQGGHCLDFFFRITITLLGILLDKEGDPRRCLQSNERHKDRFVHSCSCSNHQHTAPNKTRTKTRHPGPGRSSAETRGRGRENKL